MSFDGDLYPEAGASKVITSKGDLVRGDASGNRERYGIGSTNDVLTVASGTISWAAPAAGGAWTQLGEDSSTSGASELSVGSITQKDIMTVYAYVASAGTDSDDIEIRLNGSTASIYTMRGDYAAAETTYASQDHWSTTFGNSIPQRPVNLQLTLWKQDSNIAGNGGLCGIMVGAANYDIASSPDAVNTWANAGLLWDSTASVTSIEVSHGTNNIIGNLQVNGMDYG